MAPSALAGPPLPTNLLSVTLAWKGGKRIGSVPSTSMGLHLVATSLGITLAWEKEKSAPSAASEAHFRPPISNLVSCQTDRGPQFVPTMIS